METLEVSIGVSCLEPRTKHLQPVIEFLIMQGNVPHTHDFIYDSKGLGTFLFKYPLDIEGLSKHFRFPGTISLGSDSYYKGGYLIDRLYGLKILQVNNPKTIF